MPRTSCLIILLISLCILVNAQLVKKCRYDKSCTFSWNTPKNPSTERCCPTTGRTCKNWSQQIKNCNCGSIRRTSGTIAGRNSTCDGASAQQKREREVLKDSLSVQVARFHSDLNSGKRITMNDFFDSYFMRAYDYAYDRDVANLIAFQSLMSRKDPAPPADKLGNALFGVIKMAISKLPDVGKLITTALDVSRGLISLTTQFGGVPPKIEIPWDVFLESQALSGPTQRQNLMNGLYRYMEEFYSKNKIPSPVTRSNAQAVKVLENLLNSTWNTEITQTEAYRMFIADYMTAIGSGIIVGQKLSGSVSWTPTKVDNKQALGRKMMELTGNCLRPNINFKNNKGQQVQMSVWKQFQEGTKRKVTRWGALSANTIPIYGSDSMDTNLSPSCGAIDFPVY